MQFFLYILLNIPAMVLQLLLLPHYPLNFLHKVTKRTKLNTYEIILYTPEIDSKFFQLFFLFTPLIMPSSSSLDSTALAVDTLNPAWPICAGYLDNVLSTFKNHGHPFVLVSTLAMNWSGATPMPREEVDVLVRFSQL